MNFLNLFAFETKRINLTSHAFIFPYAGKKHYVTVIYVVYYIQTHIQQQKKILNERERKTKSETEG